MQSVVWHPHMVRVRCKSGHNVIQFAEFKHVILTKIRKIDSRLDRIHNVYYKVKGTPIYVPVTDQPDFEDAVKDIDLVRFYINHDPLSVDILNTSIHRVQSQQQHLNASHHRLSAVERELAKLSISEFPFIFTGDTSGHVLDRNIYYFKQRVQRYCVTNGISDNHLFKLIINGNIVKKQAFYFLQQRRMEFTEYNDIDNLKKVWKVLEDKYGGVNNVNALKLELNHLRQNKMSTKDYLDKFLDKKAELALEMDIQNQNGNIYNELSSHEYAEYFINGASWILKRFICDQALSKYNRTTISFEELQDILIIAIKRDEFDRQYKYTAGPVKALHQFNEYNKKDISKIPCRYYKAGYCGHGKDCNYSHDSTDNKGVYNRSRSNSDPQISLKQSPEQFKSYQRKANTPQPPPKRRYVASVHQLDIDQHTDNHSPAQHPSHSPQHVESTLTQQDLNYHDQYNEYKNEEEEIYEENSLSLLVDQNDIHSFKAIKDLLHSVKESSAEPGKLDNIYEHILTPSKDTRITRPLPVWDSDLVLQSFIDPGAGACVMGDAAFDGLIQYKENTRKTIKVVAADKSRIYTLNQSLLIPVRYNAWNNKTGKNYHIRKYLRFWRFPELDPDMILCGRDAMKIMQMNIYDVDDIRRIIHFYKRCLSQNIIPADKDINNYLKRIEYRNSGSPGLYVYNNELNKIEPYNKRISSSQAVNINDISIVGINNIKQYQPLCSLESREHCDYQRIKDNNHLLSTSSLSSISLKSQKLDLLKVDQDMNVDKTSQLLPTHIDNENVQKMDHLIFIHGPNKLSHGSVKIALSRPECIDERKQSKNLAISSSISSALVKLSQTLARNDNKLSHKATLNKVLLNNSIDRSLNTSLKVPSKSVGKKSMVNLHHGIKDNQVLLSYPVSVNESNIIEPYQHQQPESIEFKVNNIYVMGLQLMDYRDTEQQELCTLLLSLNPIHLSSELPYKTNCDHKQLQNDNQQYLLNKSEHISHSEQLKNYDHQHLHLRHKFKYKSHLNLSFFDNLKELKCKQIDQSLISPDKASLRYIKPTQSDRYTKPSVHPIFNAQNYNKNGLLLAGNKGDLLFNDTSTLYVQSGSVQSYIDNQNEVNLPPNVRKLSSKKAIEFNPSLLLNADRNKSELSPFICNQPTFNQPESHQINHHNLSVCKPEQAADTHYQSAIQLISDPQSEELHKLQSKSIISDCQSKQIGISRSILLSSSKPSHNMQFDCKRSLSQADMIKPLQIDTEIISQIATDNISTASIKPILSITTQYQSSLVPDDIILSCTNATKAPSILSVSTDAPHLVPPGPCHYIQCDLEKKAELVQHTKLQHIPFSVLKPSISASINTVNASQRDILNNYYVAIKSVDYKCAAYCRTSNLFNDVFNYMVGDMFCLLLQSYGKYKNKHNLETYAIAYSYPHNNDHQHFKHIKHKFNFDTGWVIYIMFILISLIYINGKTNVNTGRISIFYKRAFEQFKRCNLENDRKDIYFVYFKSFRGLHI